MFSSRYSSPTQGFGQTNAFGNAQYSGSDLSGKSHFNTSANRTSSQRITDLKHNNPFPGNQAATPTPAPGGKGAPAAKGAPGVARKEGKAPQAAKRGPSKGGGKGGGLAVAQIARTNALYMEPMEKSAMVGEEFDSSIYFVNLRRSPVDSFRVVLQYDPRVFYPEGVIKDPIDKFLATPGSFAAWVYADRGMIVIEGRLKTGNISAQLELARVRWKAVGPAPSSSIQFFSEGEQGTGVFAGDAMVLGDPSMDAPGIVGSDFQVIAVPPAEDSPEAPLTEDLQGGLRQVFSANEGATVRLRLVAPTRPIRVGERFFVDVFFENADGAHIDALNLVIQFDPNILEVEDYDADNWITTGLNIFDGLYHKQFPFDNHIENRAFNALGEIHYTMGTSRPDAILPTGKLASILFRAKASADRTEIAFHLPEDEVDNGTTATLLGRSDLPPGSAGLKNAWMRIEP
ncbi:MAG: hypothetical protein NTW86_09520 [Candidatus Sumerlaeota bacterium]|nr:hypothetical protein [Candidatus Sumerlaeota bacterium]